MTFADVLAVLILVIAGLTAFDGHHGWAFVFIILACEVATK